jgi:flagellar hook-associated protein 2
MITSDTGASSTSSSANPTPGGTSSSSLLSLSGLASGMDTSSIVNKLMQVAGIPRDQVYQKQEWVEWQQDAYRGINTALSTFQTAEQNLRFQSSFNPYSVTSSDQTDVTATAGSNVLQGSYTLTNINTAATATLVTAQSIQDSSGKLVQSGDTVQNSGTIFIQPPTPAGGTAPAPLQIQLTAGTTTFQSIADTINNAGIGLKASFDNATSRFVLTSATTGDAQQYIVKADASGSTVANMLVNGGSEAGTASLGSDFTFSGHNASFDMQAPGSSNLVHVSQPTNNISALGLNVTLLNNPTSSSVNINVQTDTNAVYNSIKGFVDAYNTLIDTVNGKLTEKRNFDYPPLTQSQKSSMTDNQISLWEAKAKSGVLAADPTLQGIADKLRDAVSTPVTSISNGQYNMLASIGVGVEFAKPDGTLVTDVGNTGHLQIDDTTLRAAIANNPTQVMNLFTAVDPATIGNTTVKPDPTKEGIGQRLYDLVNTSISQLVDQAGLPGGVYNDGSSLGNQVKDLSQQLSDWADRLSALQTRYNSQFTAMETAMNQLNSQSAYLSQLG